nr:hypothetical protein CFP56_28233 [Quercus suber]
MKFGQEIPRWHKQNGLARLSLSTEKDSNFDRQSCPFLFLFISQTLSSLLLLLYFCLSTSLKPHQQLVNFSTSQKKLQLLGSDFYANMK